jgi:hypothetical protein
MPADPLLLQAGLWLGAAAAVLLLLTLAAFLRGWGLRFRLVGVTSFTALLALSCLAFAISYSPRRSIEGARVLPVVFDNGADLVVASQPADLPADAVTASVEQLALNLRGSGRHSSDGLVHVRLRRLQSEADGSSRPVLVAEAVRDLSDGSVRVVQPATGRTGN